MQDTITQAELEKKMTTGSPDDNKGALGHFALKNDKEIQNSSARDSLSGQHVCHHGRNKKTYNNTRHRHADRDQECLSEHADIAEDIPVSVQ